jgi:hypothetical protein
MPQAKFFFPSVSSTLMDSGAHVDIFTQHQSIQPICVTYRWSIFQLILTCQMPFLLELHTLLLLGFEDV